MSIISHHVTLPANGGPAIEETPRANVNRPNALVNLFKPNISQIIIEVREIYAAVNK